MIPSGLTSVMGPLCLWPRLLQLSPPCTQLQPRWPPHYSLSVLAHPCLRAFARAVAFAWKTFLPDNHMAHSPASSLSVRIALSVIGRLPSSCSFPFSKRTVELVHLRRPCWSLLGVAALPWRGLRLVLFCVLVSSTVPDTQDVMSRQTRAVWPHLAWRPLSAAHQLSGV